jgi:hypothetical protein
MLTVELLRDRSAPRDARNVRRTERDRLDQRREAARIVRQAEHRRQVRGAARAWLVPRNDRELVGQRGELGLPHATVLGGSMHQHQRRPVADTPIGDLEPVSPDDLHHRNLLVRRSDVIHPTSDTN